MYNFSIFSGAYPFFFVFSDVITRFTARERFRRKCARDAAQSSATLRGPAQHSTRRPPPSLSIDSASSLCRRSLTAFHTMPNQKTRARRKQQNQGENGETDTVRRAATTESNTNTDVAAATSPLSNGANTNSSRRATSTSKKDKGTSAGRRHLGKCRWFGTEKKYGFIQPASGGKDVFVHLLDLKEPLCEGDDVEFELGEHNGRPKAVAVSKILDTKPPDDTAAKKNELEGAKESGRAIQHPNGTEDATTSAHGEDASAAAPAAAAAAVASSGAKTQPVSTANLDDAVITSSPHDAISDDSTVPSAKNSIDAPAAQSDAQPNGVVKATDNTINASEDEDLTASAHGDAAHDDMATSTTQDDAASSENDARASTQDGTVTPAENGSAKSIHKSFETSTDSAGAASTHERAASTHEAAASPHESAAQTHESTARPPGEGDSARPTSGEGSRAPNGASIAASAIVPAARDTSTETSNEQSGPSSQQHVANDTWIDEKPKSAGPACDETPAITQKTNGSTERRSMVVPAELSAKEKAAAECRLATELRDPLLFQYISAHGSNALETTRSLLRESRRCVHARMATKRRGILTALAWACHFDNAPMVELLLEAGAAVDEGCDKTRPLGVACSPTDEGALAGVPAAGPRVAVIKLLVGRDADVRSPFKGSGNTPLIAVCASSAISAATAAATILLDAGADVDAPRLDTGQTPLLAACAAAGAHGHLELITLLLARGARPDLADRHDRTPLAYLCSRGDGAAALHPGSVKVASALDRAAPESTRGAASVHLLAAAGRTDILSLLVARGADPTTMLNGSSALTNACRARHAETAAFLLHHLLRRTKPRWLVALIVDFLAS